MIASITKKKNAEIPYTVNSPLSSLYKEWGCWLYESDNCMRKTQVIQFSPFSSLGMFTLSIYKLKQHIFTLVLVWESS
jgi:hypothetical protein